MDVGIISRRADSYCNGRIKSRPIERQGSDSDQWARAINHGGDSDQVLQVHVLDIQFDKASYCIGPQSIALFHYRLRYRHRQIHCCLDSPDEAIGEKSSDEGFHPHWGDVSGALSLAVEF